MAAHRGGRWRSEPSDRNRITPGQTVFSQLIARRPQQDSNLRSRLRRALIVMFVTWENRPGCGVLGCQWGARACWRARGRSPAGPVCAALRRP
jgi:hypothetical protein